MPFVAKKTFIRGRLRWQVNDSYNGHPIMVFVFEWAEGVVDGLQEFDAEQEEHRAGIR